MFMILMHASILQKITNALMFCLKVNNAYPGSPGCVPITKNFIGAGDGFSYSGFEGCIESAERTTDYLKSLLS